MLGVAPIQLTLPARPGDQRIGADFARDGLKRFPPDLNRRDSQRVRNERILVH